MAHSISYLNCQLSLKCTIFFGIEILLRAYLVYKKSSNLVYKYYLSLFLSFSPFHQLILPISINFLIHCSTNNPPWKGHALHLVSVLLVAEPLWCCDRNHFVINSTKMTFAHYERLENTIHWVIGYNFDTSISISMGAHDAPCGGHLFTLGCKLKMAYTPSVGQSGHTRIPHLCAISK